MGQPVPTPVTVLGLGAMGRALAAAFVKAGHPTTVWNRTPGKDAELIAMGALGADSVASAVAAGDLVIACLFDHASVHETLDPVVGNLAGRDLVNLTSTEPAGARELADWASRHGISFLDGGIMATPPMIGQPGSALLYSGSADVFDRRRKVLELLGSAEYFGAEPGHASLVDFALLSGMYTMFSGYYHGAAMVRAIGMSATEFGRRAEAWLGAVLPTLSAAGAQIDSGDYSVPFQSLNFTKAAVDTIVSASRDAGVDLDIVGAVKNLVDRQVAAGYGHESSERMFESLHPPARPAPQ